MGAEFGKSMEREMAGMKERMDKMEQKMKQGFKSAMEHAGEGGSNVRREVMESSSSSKTGADGQTH